MANKRTLYSVLRFIFLATLFVSTNSRAQHVEASKIQSLKKNHLVGNVKKVETIWHVRPDADASRPYMLWSKGSSEFNTSGYSVTSHAGEPDFGKGIFINIYDSTGTIFKKRLRIKGNDTTILMLNTWKTPDILINEAGSIKTYDSNGFVRDYHSKTFDASSLNFRHYIADHYGNIIIDTNANLIFYKQYDYNSSGKMIGKRNVFRNGNIENQYWFEYDQSGNLVKTIFKEDKFGYVETFVYDKFQNLILENHTSDDGMSNYVRKFVYKYDPKGNWIEKTTYFDGKDIEKISRKIIYF